MHAVNCSSNVLMLAPPGTVTIWCPICTNLYHRENLSCATVQSNTFCQCMLRELEKPETVCKSSRRRGASAICFYSTDCEGQATVATYWSCCVLFIILSLALAVTDPSWSDLAGRFVLVSLFCNGRYFHLCQKRRRFSNGKYFHLCQKRRKFCNGRYSHLCQKRRIENFHFYGKRSYRIWEICTCFSLLQW